MTYRKKMIEVALPLEAINRASAREKSIRHGHPSTLHLWWARRPLATCRAVLFASLVDDPSSWPELFKTEEAQQKERQRLFDLIEQLVIWENSNNETVLLAAQTEIARSVARNLGDGMPEGAKAIRQYLAEKAPPVMDPFCGGGSIPLEAQRLGLRAYASDLNPVAVLITKALIEIPPKFANMPPVNPEQRNEKMKTWKGAAGLAEDVRYYGEWMRNEAEKRIGKFYPKVKLPKEHGGGEATVIAWLWARTVKCPNPACGAQMPLVRSFALSTKKGKEAHVVPVIKGNQCHFEVRNGANAPDGTVLRAKGAKCLCCGSSAPLPYLRVEGNAGRIGTRLLAVVAEGDRGRIYLSPSEQHEAVANQVDATWKPEAEMPNNPRWFSPPGYGLKTFGDLFTPRQLLALTTFSDLVRETHERVLADARAAGMDDDDKGLESGGNGAHAYSDAVSTFLGMGVDKLADRNSTISSWDVSRTNLRNTFGRQAIPMTWDFAEANPFSESTGNWLDALEWGAKCLESWSGGPLADVTQLDATGSLKDSGHEIVISTDPPYYDNIGYADLSDFFYAWLRPSLKRIYPQLFATLQVPKKPELIASPYRFGGDREAARNFFEEGLGRAFERMREVQDTAYPLTVYYAFKQSETDEEEDDSSSSQVSTGWETMLEGLLKAGFSIHGTWPMRSELGNRMIASGTNALASSIVLVCRQRSKTVTLATKRELLNALKGELPSALRDLQRGNIAPVDLAQASIGPGMSIFTRYSKVVESDGTPMKVRTALSLINQVLDEVLAEQEGEFDPDTRWALAWFEQYGLNEAKYGDAETLSKAKNVSVDGLQESGILKARGGKVKLLGRDEMPEDWDPGDDTRLSVWEISQHLIRRLEKEGEQSAADLLRKLGGLGETARDLAYRLYMICERKKWAQEALAYNGLVVAWPEISKLAREPQAQQRVQASLET